MCITLNEMCSGGIDNGVFRIYIYIRGSMITFYYKITVMLNLILE